MILPVLGQAQDETNNEQGKTATQQEPAQTFPIPIRVEIIEGEAAAKARKSSEEETRQHNEADLVAQQGMNAATQAMNEATQRMADYSFWSMLIVGLGTFLLIATLWLTRQATIASQAAVEVTREIGEAQVRAYLSAVRVHVGHGRPNGCICFSCDISNSGQSPAFDSFAFVKITLFINDSMTDYLIFHEIGNIELGLNAGTSIRPVS